MSILTIVSLNLITYHAAQNMKKISIRCKRMIILPISRHQNKESGFRKLMSQVTYKDSGGYQSKSWGLTLLLYSVIHKAELSYLQDKQAGLCLLNYCVSLRFDMQHRWL